ncbi:hypothetical protein [Rhodovulum strictum]|uniref:Uncharacterized protein n=1 Tax=Rhodovulum strictum TaxID=58314 RepID=A0A844B4U8_9RHOB|nr:hypothetical protein [Rhodovulum strictum]MRH21386.1 hypothetical protein [Rhodovulum strictum]
MIDALRPRRQNTVGLVTFAAVYVTLLVFVISPQSFTGTLPATEAAAETALIPAQP